MTDSTDPPPDEHLLPNPGVKLPRRSFAGWLVYGSGKQKTETERWAPVLLVGIAAVAAFTVWESYGPIVALFLAAVIGGIGFLALIVRALVRVGDKRPEPVIVTQTATGPPPGWYRDSSGGNRWYDGTRWTEFTQDQP